MADDPSTEDRIAKRDGTSGPSPVDRLEQFGRMLSNVAELIAVSERVAAEQKRQSEEDTAGPLDATKASSVLSRLRNDFEEVRDFYPRCDKTLRQMQTLGIEIDSKTAVELLAEAWSVAENQDKPVDTRTLAELAAVLGVARALPFLKQMDVSIREAMAEEVERNRDLLSDDYLPLSISAEEKRQIAREIADLVSTVMDASGVSDEQKLRIVRHLHRAEMELLRDKPAVERVYGRIVELGIVLGQFGEKAKPFFDALEPIIRIVQRRTAEKHLPEFTIPRLPYAKEDGEVVP